MGEIYSLILLIHYALHSRPNSKTFDILRAFLPSVVAKLSDFKNSPVFCPTLYVRPNIILFLFVLRDAVAY